MSQSNSLIRNSIRDKRNFVCSKAGDLNRIVLYVGGDNIVNKHIYVQNPNNIADSGHLYTIDRTLNIESKKIIVSGNVCLTGASLGFSGNLNVSCNGILNVSGLNFCDNSVIGNGNTYSFDLKTDKVLTLQTDIEKSIIAKNRVYQDLRQSIQSGTKLSLNANYEIYDGYLQLAKNTYPDLNPNSSGVKAVNTWTTRNIGVNVTLADCVWSPELGLFVFLNNSSTGNTRISTSPNGFTWTMRTTPKNANWRSLVWAKEVSNSLGGKGLFVATAISEETNDKPGNLVMTSPDGINWTIQNVLNNNSNRWIKVVWSPELSIFCAVSIKSGTSLDTVMTSPDGVNWTIHNTPSNDLWTGLTWCPKLGLFLAGGVGSIMTSPDGINWTKRAFYSGSFWGVIGWSPKLNLLVALSDAGSVRVITSSDGINWTIGVCPISGWRTLVWSNLLSIWISTSTSPSIVGIPRVMTSPDGFNWTTRLLTTGLGQGISALAWSDELSMFICGSQFGNYIFSSLSGLTPTSYNVFDSPFNSIDQNGNWTMQQTLKRGTYINGSQTPSVLGANLLYITNTSPINITNFTNASVNQEIVLVFFDSNTTVQNNTIIKLRGGTSFTATQNDTLTLLYTGTLWVEISRSINPV